MKKILLSVFALMTLASCQKDDDYENKGANVPNNNAVVNGADTFISADEAVKIAKQFVVAEELFGPETKSIGVDYKMAYTDLSNSPKTKASSKKPAYYIYNLGDKGYVVVSAHKVASPVLGFSMNGKFDSTKMPLGLVSILDGYSKGINKARELNLKPDAKTAVARAEFLTPGAITKGDYPAVKPILGNIQWNQSPHYNDECPPGTPVGCVATAATQIMRHWKYPKKSQGSHSYRTYSYGTLRFNYDHTWNWDAMPEEPLKQKNQEVAHLSYGVAVGLNMGFSRAGSGASTANVPAVMKKYFNYPETIKYANRRSYSYSEWVKLLQKELQAGRPMEYCGHGNGGGHAFVCDGYHSKGYYHFNWGWAGSSDGYFLLNALNPGSLGVGGGSGGFNSGQGAVIGFAPPEGWDNGGNDNGGNDNGGDDNGDGDDSSKYCSSKGKTSKYTYIAKVKFGDKEITSGASSNGYKDNTNTPFVVKRGTTVPIEFQPGFYYYQYKMHWKVWMDSNQDGKFSEKEVMHSFSGIKGLSTELNIRKGFPVGKYRIRVAAKYRGFPTSCETFDFGEVEDFTLEIK